MADISPEEMLRRQLVRGAVVGSGGSVFGRRSNSAGLDPSKNFGDVVRNADWVSPNAMNLDTFFANQGFSKDQVAQFWDSITPEEQGIIQSSSDPYRALTDMFKAKGGPDWIQKQAAARAAEGQRMSLEQELQAFYQAYKTPLTFDAQGMPTDPTARLLVQGGMGAAGNAAAKAGLDPSSGLGSLAVADQAQKSLIPYQQFREGMAAQTLGQINSRDLNLRSLAEQGRQFDAGASMQDQANQYNAQRGLGSTIGSAIGLGLGGLATVLTGGAAAPLIPGLTSLGGSIGGTAAGSSVPTSGYGPARSYGSGRGY